jgi:hypothetical protein
MVQFVNFVTHHDRMARVGTALIADHNVVISGEQVHQLPFGLVPPLQSDN